MALCYFDARIPRQDFEEMVLKQNTLCKFGRWISENWACFRDWFDDGEFETSRMLAYFGDIEVPVTICDDHGPYDSTKITTKMSQFLNELKAGVSTKYLKDWHFCEAVKSTADVFDLPEIFSCDWLNDCLIDQGKQDYRFLYCGGADTWTPFHVDVFCSYSWSVNITGHKTWLFLSSEHLSEAEKMNPPNDIRKHSHLMKNAIQVEQGPGEAIFVPSTWFHQVCNRGITVSINHNWFNAYNIHHVFTLLKSDLDLITHEISFLKDAMGDGYDDHCQVLLRANSGFNFDELKQVLEFAAENEKYGEFQQSKASRYLDKVKDVLSG